MLGTTIRITDNSNLVGAAFDEAIERALLNIGLEAERRAVIKIN